MSLFRGPRHSGRDNTSGPWRRVEFPRMHREWLVTTGFRMWQSVSAPPRQSRARTSLRICDKIHLMRLPEYPREGHADPGCVAPCNGTLRVFLEFPIGIIDLNLRNHHRIGASGANDNRDPLWSRIVRSIVRFSTGSAPLLKPWRGFAWNNQTIAIARMATGTNNQSKGDNPDDAGARAGVTLTGSCIMTPSP